MPTRTIKLREFQKLVRDWNCSVQKTTKEWEVVDDGDGNWVCGFATVKGREVKISYLKNFEKEIRKKRAQQEKQKTIEQEKGTE